jgi:IS5 family transposase
MDIFSYESARRIGDQNVLRKVDALMDWSAISVLLKNDLKRSGFGPQGYKEITLFKCLLIGQCHNLSDPKLEECLRVRFDFMQFAGPNLYGSLPDETTHCQFRNALVKAGAYDALLAEVCREIENHGLKVKEAAAAIIDATLTESAAHPRTHVKAPTEDWAEDESPDEPATVIFSADHDARWIKKGHKIMLGYKGFAKCDEEGFVDKVHTTPANVGESPQFESMIEGSNAQRVLADKAYASKANRDALKGKYRDGILHKAVRRRPLCQSEKRFNKLISKHRFRIEQCFGTMKRLFGLHRARYFGVAKTHAQMVMAAISQNLLKAANKIILNKQTPAIA